MSNLGILAPAATPSGKALSNICISESKLARCLATTNVIESPNSVVRRVSGRVTNYKDAQKTLRWTAAGFIEAEKSFKKLCDYADLKILIKSLRPAAQQLKKAA